MGTSNFCTADASATFIIEQPEDDCVNEYFWQDTRENMQDAFADFPGFWKEDKWDDNRSFSGHIFGAIERQGQLKFQGDTYDMTVKFSLIIRSGYYAHANLDYIITRIFNPATGYEYEIDSAYDLSVGDFIGYEKDHTVKQREKLLARARKWYEKTESKLQKQVDAIYKQYSQPHRVAWQASNGETGYEPCKV